MLCDICKKNEATIHIREISDGKSRTINMCEECAAKQKSEMPPFNALGLGELLYNLQNSIKEAADKFGAKNADPSAGGETGEGKNFSSGREEEQIVCPVCRWDHERIRRDGRFGCEECYHTFRELVSGAVRSVQRGERHIGKHPVDLPPPDNAGEIRRYQEELRRMVAEENYERAAELRDLLKKLSGEAGKNRNGGSRK